jgi:hypothetical protein
LAHARCRATWRAPRASKSGVSRRKSFVVNLSRRPLRRRGSFGPVGF